MLHIKLGHSTPTVCTQTNRPQESAAAVTLRRHTHQFRVPRVFEHGWVDAVASPVTARPPKHSSRLRGARDPEGRETQKLGAAAGALQNSTHLQCRVKSRITAAAFFASSPWLSLLLAVLRHTPSLACVCSPCMLSCASPSFSLLCRMKLLRGTVTHSRPLAPSKCQASVCSPTCMYNKSKQPRGNSTRVAVVAVSCSHNHHTHTHTHNPREATHHTHATRTSQEPLHTATHARHARPPDSTPASQHSIAQHAAGREAALVGHPHTASQQVG